MSYEGTDTPSYWLNGTFLTLGSGLSVFVGAAIFLIWKYEDNKEKGRGFLYKDEAWSTCHKAIHPAWLLAYRLIAFSVLLYMLIADFFESSTGMFFFYTEWTCILLTVYCGLGSCFSIYGCIQYRKDNAGAKVRPTDEERNTASSLSKGLSYDWETHSREPAGSLGYAFQIIFQISAGAVVLTDGTFWLIIDLFTKATDYTVPPLEACMHSVNAVILLGDVLLNALRFPFFRIAYFVLWTAAYVSFTWAVHMCVSRGWPYLFLVISYDYVIPAYLLGGLLHLPCYGVFALIIKLKDWLPRLFWWAFGCPSAGTGDLHKNHQEVKH